MVFLHELYGCHLEFKWVELTGSGIGEDDDKDTWGLGIGNNGYHVLIPDLPGHSASRELASNTGPDSVPDTDGEFDSRGSSSFDIATKDLNADDSDSPPSLLLATCQHLHHLIRHHAKQQRAHLVGVGYGAYIALHFSKLYPDFVSCVIAITNSSSSLTATATLSPTAVKRNMTFLTPYLSYVSLKPILTIPGLYKWIIEEGAGGRGNSGTGNGKGMRSSGGRLHKGVKVPDGLVEEMWENTKLGLAKSVYDSLRAEFDLGEAVRGVLDGGINGSSAVSRSSSTTTTTRSGVAGGWGYRAYRRVGSGGYGVGNMAQKRALLVVGGSEEEGRPPPGKLNGLGKLLRTDTDYDNDKRDGSNTVREGIAGASVRGQFMVATRGKVHAWNLHEPEVFGRMVEGWIQEGEDGLPEDLVGWKAWAVGEEMNTVDITK